MTSIFSDGSLHPGRDANDAWWIVVRTPEDWGADPRPDATRYDPSRRVLELLPRALAEGDGVTPSVVGPDGTRYTADPTCDRILVEPPCAGQSAVPLPGVGGSGWEVGRLARPVAIAIDERGWLYVAEQGNHRVSVIDPADPAGARVVITLGAVDGWGRPIAGDVRGALREPVAVAVGGGRIYVGQRAGWVQTYDRQFRTGDRFPVHQPGAAPGELLGLAVDGGELVVAAAGWSQLLRFRCDGAYIGESDWDGAPPALGALADRARFELEGTRIVGPIDGGRDGLAWHQIAVAAELPPGTSIEVQTWACDAAAVAPPTAAPIPPVLPELRVPREVTPWAPEIPVAIAAGNDEARGESTRLVHSDVATWTRWRGGPYRRGRSWSLGGTGPNGGASFTADPADARTLRAGDAIELSRRGLPTIGRAILSISDRSLAVIATGHRATPYSAGTILRLRERDGRAQDEPVLATLAGAETIDLTTITSDGGGADIVVPHRIAALLVRDDLVELSRGADRVLVKIDGIDPAPAVIDLAPPVAADYRDGTLRLVTPFDRMVCEQAEDWGGGFTPGSRLDVLVRTAAGDVHEEREVAWSDPASATVFTVTPPSPDWISLGLAGEPPATDRGRYLWIKLRLRGARRHPSDAAAFATPTVRWLRAVAPRLSYLSYLPAVFGRRDPATPTGATFLERFLAMFEGRLTRIEARYEAVARLLNPHAADDAWLDFLAGWFDLVLDPRWPRARRAALLAQIVELYRLRGTREGMLRTVEVFTGHRPALIEGFQIRPRTGMILGCAGVLGCAPLGGLDVDAAASEALLAAYAHRIDLVAHIDDDCDVSTAAPAIAALIDAIKPAHVDVQLRVASASSRIGLESTIGLDFVLGGDRPVLGGDRPGRAPLGGAGPLGQPAPILGVDATLASRAPGSPAALSGGGPPLGDFTLR
jgi:phage tail-like protein